MRKILIATLLAGVATSAFAADLPARKSAPAPAPIPYAAPFSWTGFYVGVNGGFGAGSFRGFGNTEFGDPSGGFVGGTAGYNYQIGQFVIGAEATLDWADLSKSQSFADGSTSKATVDSLGNVLARAGFAADRALFYVAGGYAGGQVHANFFDAPLATSFSNSSWQNGYSVGGGIEYAFTNNISLKAEYLFTQLSDKTYFGGSPDAVKTGLNINTVKTGLNYRF